MRLFHRRAESMIETLIAITVIVLTTAAGLSLVRSSFQANTLSSRELVAAHLAEEAASALINLRDTNYLRFPANADDCWDHFDLDSVADCSQTSHQISEGSTYALTRRFDSEPLSAWDLTPVTATQTGALSLYHLTVDDGSVDYYADPSSVTSAFELVKSEAFTRTVSITAKSTTSYTALITIAWTDAGLPHSYTKVQSILHIY